MSTGVMNERGRASGSFLMAIGVVALAVGGYLGMDLSAAGPVRVVRAGGAGCAPGVGLRGAREFQRSLDDVVRDTKKKNGDVPAAIDAAADKARQELDDVVSGARERLSEIDVELRTQRNRMERIETRAQEAREIVTEFAEETKAKARGNPPG